MLHGRDGADLTTGGAHLAVERTGTRYAAVVSGAVSITLRPAVGRLGASGAILGGHGKCLIQCLRFADRSPAKERQNCQKNLGRCWGCRGCPVGVGILLVWQTAAVRLTDNNATSDARGWKGAHLVI